jgi:hypothetical protein
MTNVCPKHVVCILQDVEENLIYKTFKDFKKEVAYEMAN